MPYYILEIISRLQIDLRLKRTIPEIRRNFVRLAKSLIRIQCKDCASVCNGSSYLLLNIDSNTQER